MKNYSELFNWNEGTVVGISEGSLVIFDGCYYNGDIHVALIAPVGEDYVEDRKKDWESYEYLWRELVADNKCTKSLIDWWDDYVSECDEIYIEHGYPGKDESGCEDFLFNDALRQLVDSDYERVYKFKPFTWECEGGGDCEYITSFDIVYEPEIAREIVNRSKEIQEEKRQLRDMARRKKEIDYNHFLMVVESVASEDMEYANALCDAFIKFPDILLRPSSVFNKDLADLVRYSNSIPSSVDKETKDFLIRMCSLHTGSYIDSNCIDVVIDLCNIGG